MGAIAFLQVSIFILDFVRYDGQIPRSFSFQDNTSDLYAPTVNNDSVQRITSGRESEFGKIFLLEDQPIVFYKARTNNHRRGILLSMTSWQLWALLGSTYGLVWAASEWLKLPRNLALASVGLVAALILSAYTTVLALAFNLSYPEKPPAQNLAQLAKLVDSKSCTFVVPRQYQYVFDFAATQTEAQVKQYGVISSCLGSYST